MLGNSHDYNHKLIIHVITGSRTDRHVLRRDVGIGSREHVADLEALIMFSISSFVAASNLLRKH